ncbi:hypothetical protein NF699_02475 [Sphingomonadaceae bacterium OTU29LAMAA1]|nr:hypothetical protein NF699_02475 [Sphingomonadaceae bacterium OTU29LAMAA1]
MGIEVSAAKAVTINDQHENGVDTSVAGTPYRARFQGMPLLHVFSRNQRGQRRDDGNPLIHALKGRRGFSILPFWKSQLMARARLILEAPHADLEKFDFVLPLPSSSPFCAEFAAMVSDVSGTPILEPTFLRKRTVGEVLAEAKANPPARMSPRQRSVWGSQMHAWEGTNPDAIFQAKDTEIVLRPFFRAFAVDGEGPDLTQTRVLVVDDIFATGSSLASARDILENGFGASIAAIGAVSLTRTALHMMHAGL